MFKQVDFISNHAQEHTEELSTAENVTSYLKYHVVIKTQLTPEPLTCPASSVLPQTYKVKY